MRLAHLILAHTNPRQLNRLIGRLSCDDADFYVHIDLKANIRPFLPIRKAKHVYFVMDRVKVTWAGYSQVESTLNGIKEILASGEKYDYINLLSGQDYPIKSTEEIHSFFRDHPGRAFMNSQSIEKEWLEAVPRITKYHLEDVQFPGKHLALRVLNTFAPKRKVPLSLAPMGRATWFTITPQQAEYIVDFVKQHPEIPRFFKLSWAPDEMMFQTILNGSPFKKDIVNDNLRYVDWSNGGASPKILTIADAEALSGSTKLFARKFNPEIDTEILDYLDKKTSKT